jgi:hypothetical protein
MLQIEELDFSNKSNFFGIMEAILESNMTEYLLDDGVKESEKFEYFSVIFRIFEKVLPKLTHIDLEFSPFFILLIWISKAYGLVYGFEELEDLKIFQDSELKMRILVFLRPWLLRDLEQRGILFCWFRDYLEKSIFEGGFKFLKNSHIVQYSRFFRPCSSKKNLIILFSSNCPNFEIFRQEFEDLIDFSKSAQCVQLREKPKYSKIAKMVKSKKAVQFMKFKNPRNIFYLKKMYICQVRYLNYSIKLKVFNLSSQKILKYLKKSFFAKTIKKDKITISNFFMIQSGFDHLLPLIHNITPKSYFEPFLNKEIFFKNSLTFFELSKKCSRNLYRIYTNSEEYDFEILEPRNKLSLMTVK